jgi:hypothetical protein
MTDLGLWLPRRPSNQRLQTARSASAHIGNQRCCLFLKTQAGCSIQLYLMPKQVIHDSCGCCAGNFGDLITVLPKLNG